MAKEAKQIKTHIRWMIRRDMAVVMDIERRNFGDHAWGEDDFVRTLRQRHNIGMVATHDENVVGYMIYELRKTQLNVLNFAVHPGLHRRGIGRSMVEKLRSKLSMERRTKITLLVSEYNTDAQLFFRDLGFYSVGSVSGAYEDPKGEILSGHDGIAMICRGIG